LSSFVIPCVVVRIVLDYRPALRARTGVGEFVHELGRALTAESPDSPPTLLSTSWKDRVSSDARADLPTARIVDRRIPVQALTWSWNRLGWPPVEWLTGPCDVVHGQSPLLIPTTRAAQVLTIHDLHFLTHPEQAEREMRRDFPTLVHAHAHRADHIVVSSTYAANEVRRRLEIDSSNVTVCAAGAPRWGADVARARAHAGPVRAITFLGTVEPRKNIRGLLESYARLRQQHPGAPPLVIAGGIREAARPDLDRVASPPLAGQVTIRGYVSDDERRTLYRDAAMLVLPSFEEGFGLPVLEAMACGVPVVISNRGSLPEVAGDSARPIDPDDIDALATEMARLLDPSAAAEASARGSRRAALFTWKACAESAMRAYGLALARRRERSA
jgi:glycosyltransferase involved in cell wall biosynthesis